LPSKRRKAGGFDNFILEKAVLIYRLFLLFRRLPVESFRDLQKFLV